jgi:uncharacterized protein
MRASLAARVRWITATSLVASSLIVTSESHAQTPVLVAERADSAREPRSSSRQRFSIVSAILGETRHIGIALPPSFGRSAPSRRYPVVVVLDGEASIAPMSTVADELARNGQAPELVIVAIENTNRLRDLTPPGLSVSGSSTREGGDRFLDFIERELLPAVDERFRTAEPRTLVGHSSGGILATYAAATRPTYRAVLALDTPVELGERWLIRKLVARARATPQPLRYAAIDARFPWADDAWRSLVAAAPSSWSLYHEHLAHESHESMPLLGMYLGLRTLFADYSMLAAPVAPTTSILPYYAKVSTSLGAPVVPPRKLLSNVIEDLQIEGRGAAARQAYDTLVASYGMPADGAALSASIAEVEGRPPPRETVESLLATPFPTPDEARAYLGEWVGDDWMSTDEPRTGRKRLRIRVVNGKVVGETIDRPMPGLDPVRRWTYLRVTPTGMTFGYMNGMRPRGMLLYEGTRTGDTLSGEIRFGGVSFRMPDGSPAPAVHFSYRRVAR